MHQIDFTVLLLLLVTTVAAIDWSLPVWLRGCDLDYLKRIPRPILVSDTRAYAEAKKCMEKDDIELVMRLGIKEIYYIGEFDMSSRPRHIHFRYKPNRQISDGLLTDIWEAMDYRTFKRVALKISKTSRRELTTNEIESGVQGMTSISTAKWIEEECTNLIRVHEIESVGDFILKPIDCFWFEMKYVIVFPLMDGNVDALSMPYFEQYNSYTWDFGGLKKLATSILHALKPLHAARLAHCNVKPSYILYRGHPQASFPRITADLDYVLGGFDSMTEIDKFPPAYSSGFLAPEFVLFNSGMRASPQQDIWAFGLTLSLLIKPDLSDKSVLLIKSEFAQPKDIVRAIWSIIEKFSHRDINQSQKIILASFLYGLLERDPAKRLTIDQAILHPFINDGNVDPSLQERFESDLAVFSKVKEISTKPSKWQRFMNRINLDAPARDDSVEIDLSANIQTAPRQDTWEEEKRRRFQQWDSNKYVADPPTALQKEPWWKRLQLWFKRKFRSNEESRTNVNRYQSVAEKMQTRRRFWQFWKRRPAPAQNDAPAPAPSSSDLAE